MQCKTGRTGAVTANEPNNVANDVQTNENKGVFLNLLLTQKGRFNIVNVVYLMLMMMVLIHITLMNRSCSQSELAASTAKLAVLDASKWKSMNFYLEREGINQKICK